MTGDKSPNTMAVVGLFAADLAANLGMIFIATCLCKG